MANLQNRAGFTLIELVIALTIVGILAAIAYPSYQESVRKSRRSDAKAGLLSLQLTQEKFRANCIQYATAIGNTESCATGNFTAKHASTSPDGYYNLSITSASATSYTLSADPTGVQAGDAKCDPMTIDQDGNKTPADCW